MDIFSHSEEETKKSIIKNKVKKEDPLIETKSVKSAVFKYDFEEIRKAKYRIDPNSFPVLDNPLKFDFFHDNNQQKHIANQINLYSHHAIPLGKLLQNQNLNIIFRKFNKSKQYHHTPKV